MTAITSAVSGPWGSASTWTPVQVPTTADDVTIAASHVVTLSGTGDAKTTTVYGHLTLDPTTTSRLVSAGGINVAGVLESQPSTTVDGTGTPTVQHVIRGSVTFVGTGVPLWVGFAKTCWSEATAAVAVGDDTVQVKDRTGWGPNDCLAVAPSARKSLTVDIIMADGTGKATAAHPLNTMKMFNPDGTLGSMTIGTEVLNLDRNVQVVGAVAFHNDASATPLAQLPVMDYVRLEQSPTFGVELLQLNEAFAGAHFIGGVVSGAADRAIYNHSYTAALSQGSHGITWEEWAAYDCVNDAFTQDADINTRIPAPAVNHTFYLNCLVLKVKANGSEPTGFMYGNGGGNKAIGCRAAAVAFDNTTTFSCNPNGHKWPEAYPGADGVWVTEDDVNYPGLRNVAHNNNGHGIWGWQNTFTVHSLDGYILYNNLRTGIRNGAYGNPYCFGNGICSANSEAALELPATALAAPATQLMYGGMVFDARGQSAYTILNTEHAVETNPPTPQFTLFQGCYVGGGHTALVGITYVNDIPDLLDFDANCVLDLPQAQWVYFGAGVHTGCVVNFHQKDGSTIQATPVDPGGGTFVASWNGYMTQEGA